jgi:hypothetical protein
MFFCCYYPENKQKPHPASFPFGKKNPPKRGKTEEGDRRKSLRTRVRCEARRDIN